VIWRAFRKTQPAAGQDAWWKEAEAVAADPAPDRIAALVAALDSAASNLDDREQQDEMIDGLRTVAAFTSAPLPVVQTQHRAIGTDTCHVIAPASLVGDAGSAGKLFVTSTRLIFTGSRQVAWPWHRLRQVMRQRRTLLVVASGAAEPLHVQCNTFGDALIVEHAARTLSAGGRP
jgi:hypothetical protein